MKPNNLIAPEDANREISALIDLLHRTERRLEVLTGGEVDTVADKDGRVLMLRRAQDHMRQSDITRQAAILDALQANIALLDTEGRIISVNNVWRRFATDNALVGPKCGIGLNYLEICDTTHGGQAQDARQAAAGIRSVLRGAVKKFSIEYSCHSSSEWNWFLMTATPIADGLARGAVIMHVDISERKRAKKKLRESERRLSSLLANVDLISVMLDREGHITYCNDYLLRLTGWRLDEVMERNWFALFIPHELQALKDSFFPASLANLPDALHNENEILTRSGERRLIRWNSSVLRAESGDVIGIASIGQDITEYARATEELKFKNTMLLTQQETSLDGILVADENGHIVSYNRRFLDLWNIPAHFTRSGLEASMINAAASQVADPEAFVARVEYLYAHHEDESDEQILLKDGRSIDRYSAPIIAATNKYYGRIWYFRDITAQKQAQIGLERLNRIYAVLSEVNSLILRVRDHDELFHEVCRIAIENGNFIKVAVAVVEPASMRLAVVASQGFDSDLVESLTGELGDNINQSHSLQSQAVRGRKPAIANDIRDSPHLPFHAELLASGSRAIAVLPLLVDEAVMGVIALHSGEPNFFDHQEVKLLLELAANISFALDHIEKSKKVVHLAYYDQLTGLANRILYLERVTQHLRSATARGHKLAVFLLDLERFKNFNDSLGRPAGDALLQQVAQWLTLKNGNVNLLARIDTDHFAVVLPEVKSDGNLTRLIENALDAFVEHTFCLNENMFRVGARIGVALYPDDGADADTLFRNAEAALKKAKTQGERYLFYKQSMTDSVASRLSLENQLRQALYREEFVLHYQPKVNLANGKLTGAEALIRWNDPHTGLVPPSHFIPILEETGLIYDVGRWALKTAIADYLRWRNAGLPAVRIAVNVSPLQLRHRDFIADIALLIGMDVQAREGIELEITENLIMKDVENTIASLSAIRAQGVRIAIDDFGTGFSSLSYLARLPVDTLKIDRSFVTEMTVTPQGLALVSGIIDLAHALELKVVAEGVETEEQSRLLRLLQCDEMQGFLFSRPVPTNIFESQFLTPSPNRAGT